MARTASEAEVRLLLQGAVDILETFRIHADDTHAATDGKLQVLEERVTGEFPPAPIAAAVANFRAGLSALISPAQAREFLDPIVFEYGRIISEDSTDSFGGGYASTDAILEALYEFFVAQSPDTTLTTRGINFDSSITAGGSNVGNGTMARLTVDENAFEIEACTVEKKHFRCRQDANNGTDEEAEVFEHLGQQASGDNLLLGTTGSGLASNVSITASHAGGGDGGSLLSNGSFGDHDGTDFTSWDKTVGAASTLAQETTIVYRSHPGESTSASAKLTVASSQTITLKQTLSNMATNQLRRDRPYFLRVMVYVEVAAAGGTVTLTLGKLTPAGTATKAISAFTDVTWTEMFVPLDKDVWFKNFNEDTFDIELEWTGGTAGSIYLDDVIFKEMDLIDGTYYTIRAANATPVRWLVDDTLEFTDTYDGSFGVGTIQYWIYYAYGRYLPHTTGTPTIADP